MHERLTEEHEHQVANQDCETRDEAVMVHHGFRDQVFPADGLFAFNQHSQLVVVRCWIPDMVKVCPIHCCQPSYPLSFRVTEASECAIDIRRWCLLFQATPIITTCTVDHSFDVVVTPGSKSNIPLSWFIWQGLEQSALGLLKVIEVKPEIIDQHLHLKPNEVEEGQNGNDC